MLNDLLSGLRGDPTSIEEGTFEKDVLSHFKAQKRGYQVTTMELSLAFGMPEKQVKARMAKLVKAGKVKASGGKYVVEDANPHTCAGKVSSLVSPEWVMERVFGLDEMTLAQKRQHPDFKAGAKAALDINDKILAGKVKRPLTMQGLEKLADVKGRSSLFMLGFHGTAQGDKRMREDTNMTDLNILLGLMRPDGSKAIDAGDYVDEAKKPALRDPFEYMLSGDFEKEYRANRKKYGPDKVDEPDPTTQASDTAKRFGLKRKRGPAHQEAHSKFFDKEGGDWKQNINDAVKLVRAITPKLKTTGYLGPYRMKSPGKQYQGWYFRPSKDVAREGASTAFGQSRAGEWVVVKAWPGMVRMVITYSPSGHMTQWEGKRGLTGPRTFVKPQSGARGYFKESENMDRASTLLEELETIEEGLKSEKNLSKSRLKGLVNRAWDWNFYQDLDDRYYFDGQAINLQRDWKDLSAMQVQQIARAFGVKQPHRSKRVAARQTLEAIRDMKRRGVKKAPMVEDVAAIEEASTPNPPKLPSWYKPGMKVEYKVALANKTSGGRASGHLYGIYRYIDGRGNAWALQPEDDEAKVRRIHKKWQSMAEDVETLEEGKWGMSEKNQLEALLKKAIGRKAMDLSATWWGDYWRSASIQHITPEENKKIQAVLKGKKLGGDSIEARYDAGLKTVYIDRGRW